MPRLVIFRRQRLHRLIELSDRLLKIGRGRQNDIVLEDHEQVVSRFHAELRPELESYGLAWARLTAERRAANLRH